MSRSIDDITSMIINLSIYIHRRIGPGALESVYEAILQRVLERHGLQVDRQISIPFKFEDMQFDEGFRLDLLVERKVIVEVKSRENVKPVHLSQLLTYLKLTDLRVGLLINFGAPLLKDGIHRIVNNLPPGDSPILRVNRPKN